MFCNAVIIDGFLRKDCSIGDDTTIERCEFERNVTINRRSYIDDSNISCFSYGHLLEDSAHLLEMLI